jgi:chromosome partitioning protein
MKRVGQALEELSRRVGFRVIPGLGERVIYRELFPKGLTLLDLKELGNVGLSHIAARQELREMIAGFGIPTALKPSIRRVPEPRGLSRAGASAHCRRRARLGLVDGQAQGLHL